MRERAQRLEVVAVDAVRCEPRVEGVELALELVLPDVAEALVQPDLVLIALRDRDLTVDDLDQLVLAFAVLA